MRTSSILYNVYPPIVFSLSTVGTVMLTCDFFQVRQMVVAILSEYGMDLDEEVLDTIIDKVIVCRNIFSLHVDIILGPLSNFFPFFFKKKSDISRCWY